MLAKFSPVATAGRTSGRQRKDARDKHRPVRTAASCQVRSPSPVTTPPKWCQRGWIDPPVSPPLLTWKWQKSRYKRGPIQHRTFMVNLDGVWLFGGVMHDPSRVSIEGMKSTGPTNYLSAQVHTYLVLRLLMNSGSLFSRFDSVDGGVKLLGILGTEKLVCSVRQKKNSLYFSSIP